MTGDFNEPSHLDWVLGAENPMFFICKMIFLSLLLIGQHQINANAGLIDTYRNLYPNPIITQVILDPKYFFR